MDENLKGSTSRPGKDSYTTTNPNEATKYAQGNVLPKLYGGFSTSLRVLDFDFSASFDYQIGGKVTDNRYASLMTLMKPLPVQAPTSIKIISKHGV